VGRHRGAGLGGGHDEREQTLNQILVELDGFETNESVIVVAATNRPDVLDPALLRPGRFDRRVVLDLPDISDREEILKIHAKSKSWDRDVHLRVVAERTPGFSGADLANVVNEAAILAARSGRKSIAQSDLVASIEKVMLGPERKSHILTPSEKEIVAYHEAGHALVAASLKHTDPVHKISIVARGRAGGHTATVDIDYDGTPIAVDTGFIVYNEHNYHDLTALFAHLNVATHESDMGFSLSLDGGKLEWSGQSYASIFAQRRNLFSPRFLKMLSEILRFNKQCVEDRDTGRLAGLTIGDYLVHRRFSPGFRDNYLVPMAAAIWSTVYP